MGRVLSGWAPGVHLNAEGVRQARELAHALRDAPIARVYSSPLERAVETARPLADQLRIPLELDREFGEFNAGLWTGRSFDELMAEPAWRSYNQHRERVTPPGGEAASETQTRIVRAIERISVGAGGAMIAIVSHAEPIRYAILHYLGAPIGTALHLDVSPASVSVISIVPSGAQILLVNGRRL